MKPTAIYPMRFSIIIPTLNEETTIVACLTALQVLRTTCELIVVDANSHDNTRGLASPLVDKIINSEKGRAIQMNTGAQHSTGEVLTFLHADTCLPRFALDLIDKSICKDKPWGRFDVQLSGKSIGLKVIAFMMNWRSRITGIATGDQVIFVSRLAFDAIGGYPKINLMEDIALCKALKTISPPICLKAKVISSGRRWEQNGICRTVLLMWGLRLGYFFGADPKILQALYYRNTHTFYNFKDLWSFLKPPRL
ncbi:MAG: TIGR04283 family arsenosugar biosynthesis glycosyltransferase [Methylococcales bacterium]|nr:TIGR04283 family arsenosugar biosynthesis glycosyltransferase [Methylococcales bacterium]